jgi:hypothetical protein
MYSKLTKYDIDLIGYDHTREYVQLEVENYCTSDTLVLHPHDPTTDFLRAIYEDKGWDVINEPLIRPEQVTRLIKKHDRVVMLGHGTPEGLFGGFGFLIEENQVPALKAKTVIAIWCHANQFVEKHGLKGFYSGMFISELPEAWLYGIGNTDEQAIEFSNDLFAVTLGKYVDSDNLLDRVKAEYFSEHDPVIRFNHKRLFFNEV